ncbi:hypothetical protein Aperf_G00000045457 [Anoplocephala perfoliata]
MSEGKIRKGPIITVYNRDKSVKYAVPSVFSIYSEDFHENHKQLNVSRFVRSVTKAITSNMVSMADAYYKFPASVRHLIVSQVSQLRKHRKIHFSSKEIAMILQIYYTITGYRARLMTQSECVDFLTGSLGITNTQTLEGILRVTVQIRGSEKYLERSGIPAENFVLMLSVYLRGSLLERADMAFNIMDFDRDGMLRKQVEFRRFLTGSFATEIAATHADIDPDQPIRESIQYLENLLISDSDDGVDLKRFKEIALQQPWVVDCLLPISCCELNKMAFDYLFLLKTHQQC